MVSRYESVESKNKEGPLPTQIVAWLAWRIEPDHDEEAGNMALPRYCLLAHGQSRSHAF